MDFSGRAGTVFGWMQFVHALLISNILFIGTNLLFLFFFLTLSQTMANSWIYWLALLPAGPFVHALLASMDELVQTGSITPARAFVEKAKQSWKESAGTWALIVTTAFVLILDMHWLKGASFSGHLFASAALFAGLGVFLLVSLNVLIIQARFSFRTRDIWRIAAFYTANKWRVTCVNIIILLTGFLLLTVTNGFVMILLFSTSGWLIMKASASMLTEIQTTWTN